MPDRPPITEIRLNRFLTRAIAFPMALMAVLAVVLLLQITRLLALTEWVEHTDRVTARAHSVERLILERDAGLRGYLLTGAPEFLLPYRRAGSLVPAGLNTLAGLVRDDPKQSGRVRSIASHYYAWIAFARQATRKRETGSNVAAYVATGAGKREVDAIHKAVGALVSAEEELRGERTQAVRAATQRIAVTGVGLTILLGGLLAFISRRQLMEVTRSYRKALDAAEQRAAVLQQSESRFRSLSDSNLIGVVLLDFNGPLVDANDAFLRIVGYSREDVAAGLPWIELIPPEIRDQRDSAVTEFRITGVWAPAVQELIRKDGSRASVWIGGTLVEGFSDRAICFVLDTTERRRAEDSLRFVADASKLLGASLDYGAPLRRVARLAVPTVADWCVIDVLDEEETLQRVAAAHVDPAKEDLALELSRRYRPDPGRADPLLALVRGGAREFYPRIPDSLLRAAARDEDHLAMLRELGFASCISVPLVARGRTLGAITLVMGGSGRVFEEPDLALAEDLARRVAVAIDNARLYHDAQQELADRRKAEAALEENRTQIEALNERLRRAMTETHHRVKNNLQIITAMIDMRLMEHHEVIPVEEFRRLGSVVSTLAAVHHILTHEAEEDGQAHFMSAADILEKLMPLLQRTAGERRIHFRVQDVRLSARQGTSMALIVNELVSNAIKYGKGEVDVALCVRDGTAAIEVVDDGPGFPKGFDPARDASTGIELVERLSRWDLAGKARYENRPGGGACVSVVFPVAGCEGLDEPNDANGEI